MKTVLLLRHAKSKRGPEYETDFERPLAGRGERDAPRMGAFLAEQGPMPDMILSSAAERARQTALLCAEAADYMGEIRFEETLYDSGVDGAMELFWALDNAVQTVLMVGHNPDIAELVEMLSGEWTRMPTAALARIDCPIDSWADLDERGGQLTWVRVPREL